MYADVREDVAARVKQDFSMDQRLKCDRCNKDRFFVRLYGSHEIVFTRQGEDIQIGYAHQSGEKRHLLTVTVGMNDQGECTLHDGDKELHSWQVRRIALEETLFG